MGGGSWSNDAYRSRTAFRAAKGIDTFAYSTSTASKPAAARKAHDELNPFGVKVRECRDSDEHPNATPIIIQLDVTGSMGAVITGVQKNLCTLMNVLLVNSFVPDPQIMITAVGDATCDRVPYQMGQFEADIRIETNLTNLFIEGNGGGQMSESYALGLWAAANKTAADAWEKRGRKGYLFMIGDEMSWPVLASEIKTIFGDAVQSDFSVEECVRAAQERYHVFYILPKGAYHGGDSRVLAYWRKLLGQCVLELDDPKNCADLIGAQIAAWEGNSVDVVADALKAAGGDASVTSALSIPELGTGELAGVGNVSGGSLISGGASIVRP